jgi:hypothetical protein
MRVTNKDAEMYYDNLMSIAGKVTGKLGYSISRNIRKLNIELKEYFDMKNKAIREYGEKGENEIYSLKTDSPKFQEYLKEMAEIEDVKISVDIMKVNPEDVYDSSLSASEMLLIDFMIKEE